MAKKRQSGYRGLGYRVRSTAGVRAEEQTRPVDASAGDDRRPSQVFDQYWIHAERKNDDLYPEHGERGGKWMLFIKTAEIDAWWAKIKAATESGLLGNSAKAATMRPNPNAAADTTRLICVYTYDVDDERDCLRVREALRNLGVNWKIPYKTDADTYAGKYATSGVRVSKRYE
jgi:hypothetical protein